MHKPSTLKKALLSLALTLAGTFTLATAVASAIPYSGATTPNSPIPAFNVYTGVPSVGNEFDFLRARVPTAPSGDTTTQYVDPLAATCVPGQRIQMRVYIHNGAAAALNNGGTGPSVAHNTKVKVGIPTATATSFTPTATVSSSNAVTVNDNVSIHCSNATAVTLAYMPGSASQFSIGSGVVPLDDAIVTTGVPVRSQTVPGDVWGCWDERVYVILSVQVMQKEVPPPVVTNALCKVLDVVVTNAATREVRATVTGEVTNATITGYSINFGDGTTANTQTATHTYAKDGTFTITSSITAKLADGTTVTKTATACNKQVTFKADVPPVVEIPPIPEQPAPPVLPNTGPGAIAATFFGVSGLSTMAYYARRKFGL